MTYALVFAAGFIAEYAFGRWVLRFFRKENSLRADLFARMTYDGLLKFRKAVDEEITRRQP